MPQLDKVTFFSQFFWLCVFFFGFYIFQLKYFLPEMSRILKLRKKRLSESLAFTLQDEKSKVENSASTLLENLFKNSKNIFKKKSSNSDLWFSNYANKANMANFKKGNVKYLQSIAEKSLSNNIAMLAVNHDFSEKIFFSRLSKNILGAPKTSSFLTSKKAISSVTDIDDSEKQNAYSFSALEKKSKLSSNSLKAEFLKKRKNQHDKSAFSSFSSVKATQKTRNGATISDIDLANPDKSKKETKSISKSSKKKAIK